MTADATEELIRSATPRCEWSSMAADAAMCVRAAETVMRVDCGCTHLFCFTHGTLAAGALRAEIAHLRDDEYAYCNVHTGVFVRTVELEEL